MIDDLRVFQREVESAVESPDYDTVAMSGPRGLGKTALAGHILERCLTPGDVLHEPGKEYLLGAASIEQARLTFGFIREGLEPTGEYRWIDSVTRLGVRHVKTNTRLRVFSSNAKTAFGFVGNPLLVLDEPGALEIAGGQLLSDAIFTGQGKPNSSLKVLMVGTLAPMATGAGHWWYDLIDSGTTGRTYVKKFQGDTGSWDNWHTIRKANPLTSISAEFRRKLLEERDAARADTRLKARFWSYRLNVPSADESTTLLTVDDWQRVEKREVPDRSGKFIVGCDLGGGRAWSGVVAMWPNGRIEALAVAPGIPSIQVQEKRDRVPRTTYSQLVERGALRVAHGLRVQPPAALIDSILTEWGKPRFIVCDRFRVDELRDAAKGIRIVSRVSRWSESSSDIRALRKYAKDGPLSCDPNSRLLLKASLSAALVKSDDAGNQRLQKRNANNTARDDVAQALVLVAGANSRTRKRKSGKLSLGVVE